MKKQVKIIALILVVAVALVGAGYAAWGTVITDTTTLRTAEWNIVLENDSTYSYWAGDQIGYFGADPYGHTNTDPTSWTNTDYTYDGARVSSDDLSGAYDFVYVLQPMPAIPKTIEDAADAGVTDCIFSFYNLHPGTRALTRFEVRNDGSISARVSDVKVVISGADGAALTANDWAVIGAMKVNPVLHLHTGSGSTATDIELLDGDTPYTLGELRGILYNALKDQLLLPDYTLRTYAASTEMETGTDAGASFNFELPASALNGNIGQNAGFQIKIEFDFVQYNQGTMPSQASPAPTPAW